jgi:acyl carrier protein
MEKKTYINHSRSTWLLLFFIFISSAFSLTQGATTAFEARAIAGSILDERTKNNVLQIFASHTSSTDGLIPNEWRVSFWDPTHNKVVLVLFDGLHTINLSNDYEGYFMDHDVINEFSEKDAIDPLYLQIDSDKAVQIAMNLDEVKGITISSVEFSLLKSRESVEPVWTLTFYTIQNEIETDAVKVELSADSGEVLQVILASEKETNFGSNR